MSQLPWLHCLSAVLSRAEQPAPAIMVQRTATDAVAEHLQTRSTLGPKTPHARNNKLPRTALQACTTFGNSAMFLGHAAVLMGIKL